MDLNHHQTINKMKIKISLLIIIILAVFLNACEYKTEPKSPKNIILMIGDGMGTSQLYAAYVANKGFLNIERCTHSGFAKTYCLDSLITDSGASGTAIATGYKTNLKMIGMTPDGLPKLSILKYAEQNDLSTGIVVACSMTHATPAAFVANNESRYNYEEMALDYLKTDIEVFIGGGLSEFNNREDGLNLIDSLKARNYQVVYSLDELKNAKPEKIAGLLYDKHPPYFAEGRGNMLEIGSLKAIETLNKNKKGFFMMVEGSQIDWAGHDNFKKQVISEVQDFDRTVGAVLDFAEKDGETLVIVTADHETGGLTVIGGNLEKGTVNGSFSTGHHTATMVPVFAFGPGAEAFTGIMDNTDIFKKMARAFQFIIN